MRTRLLKTVIFCFGLLAGGTALAQTVSDPAGDRSDIGNTESGSSGRWDNPGYLYGSNNLLDNDISQDDLSLRSSAGMRPIWGGTTDQDQFRSTGCDLEKELNVIGGGCVPLGPE